MRWTAEVGRTILMATCLSLTMTACGSTNPAVKAQVQWEPVGDYETSVTDDPAVRKLGGIVVSPDLLSSTFARWKPSLSSNTPVLPEGKKAVFIAAGSGATSIGIEEITQVDGVLHVAATLREPGDNCTTSAVVRHVFTVIAVDSNAPNAVEIDAERNKSNC
jgi:hypothetical protein